MRRALGPFLTTGVALVAATVVVANPLAPPSRDMQISTTQLSTSPELLSPSDKSLLNALAPQFPPAGIGPALAQILAALAADADRISRAVDSETPAASPLAASLPEQTAYRPDSAGAAFVESPNAAASVPLNTNFTSNVVSSEVVQALNGLVADTSYLGGKVFEAAYAVVDVIIKVPQFVINAALDLLNGDIAGALNTVKSAIAAFFGPGLIILDGIRDVLFGRPLPPVPPPTAIKRLVASATAGGNTPATGTGQTVTGTETTTDAQAAAEAHSGRDGKSDSAPKRDTTPAATTVKSTSTTAKPAASTGTPTTSKTRATTGKPTTGSARSTAGSARDSKSAGSSSSSD